MKILFTPLIMGKPWCGATIYEAPLGGSEKAVVYLARELARRGHEVTVHTSGVPGQYEQVSYLPMEALGGSESPSYDVHISSRWQEILGQMDCKASVLWLHDLPQPGASIKAHHVVCISEYQRECWKFNPDNPFLHVIGDGVDLSLFAGRERRDPNRLVWISNPDRGVYLACKIFREQIVPRWPDMEFHIYGRYSIYGWTPQSELPFLPPPSWIGENIFLHEPLPSLGIARELMKAHASFYPTFWPETFCMAALEAQAAGTPVISNLLGALAETVKGGILGNDFVNAISQLQNKSRWEKLSTAGKEQAAKFSWAQIALQWETFMEEALQ